jgi:hypothetical protein
MMPPRKRNAADRETARLSRIQGYNVPHIGPLTMGRSWRNNQHAFPGSVKLGFRPSQHDPDWWVLYALRSLRHVLNLNLPTDLPTRPELVPIDTDTSSKVKDAELAIPGRI